MKKYIRYILVSIIVIIGTTLILINNNKEKEYKKNMFYMNTYIEIKIYTNNKQKAETGFREVEKIYQKYHNLTDRYNETSNLYYIHNNKEKSGIISIDKTVYQLLEKGLEWNKLSNGLLNINMGNIIDIWKKYRENKTGIPTEEELKNSGSIDIKQIELLGNNQIKNNHPNIDLGAMVKGEATKIAGETLKEKQISKFIINAGGNVLVGSKKNKEPYKIGIESPKKDGTIYQIVKGENISVVTSGSYERFYEYNGKTYHHIINPNTKWPSDYMQSVTVIAEDSALADILSTILFLMPVEDGKTWLKQMTNAEAIWYENDGKIIKSEGFSKYE